MKTTPDTISINLAGHDVLINIVRHKQARNIRLTMIHRQSLRLTLPMNAPLKKAHAFLEDIRPWLTKKLGEPVDYVPFSHGASFPILGVMHTLQWMPGDTENVTVEKNILCVSGREERLTTLLYAFLDKQLGAFCCQHSDMYAKQLGVKVLSIRIKNVRTKWGSCSSRGNLAFARQLVFAPEEIVKYICAHEVAHLREMNHSDKFWSHVEALFPAHKTARAWLKEHGKDLWAYGAAS